MFLFRLKPLLWALLVTLSTASLAENTTVLNFKDADIRNVIEAVSKATGKNFLIDPRVSGKVTMVSSSEMSPDNLYNTFLSILKVHGFIAVNLGNNLFKVVPATESRTEANIESTPAPQPANDEVLMEIVEIKHVAATALIPILRPLISKNGHLAAHADSNNIIISDTQANIKKLHSIVAKIDHANESELKVFKLRNADAGELAGILNNITGKNVPKKGAKKRTSIVAEERTNSLLVRGSKAQIKSISGLIRTLDISTAQRSGIAVVRLNHSKAEDISAVLEKMLSGGSNKKDDIITEGDIQVSMDKKANAIVVSGSPKAVAEMEGIIRKLDIKRSQILVEAIIVEMNADKSTQLGIQWSGVPTGTTGNNTSSAGAFGTIIGQIKTNGLISFNALATALASDADANLLSTPSIMTLENEEAVIEVGQEVPFVTGTYTANNSGSNNPFQTIERKNVGLKLKITPQISDGNTVKLSIEQEISGLLANAKAVSDTADVITSQRIVKTNVMVENGRMLVIGGLIQDNVRENDSGIPAFRKLPIFGGLFTNKSTTKAKNNLMIFIRPLIVNSNEHKRVLTQHHYNRVRNLQLQKRKQGVALIPKAKQPVLPNAFQPSTPVAPRPQAATTRATANRMVPKRPAPVYQHKPTQTIPTQAMPVQATRPQQRSGPLGKVVNWFKKNNRKTSSAPQTDAFIDPFAGGEN